MKSINKYHYRKMNFISKPQLANTIPVTESMSNYSSNIIISINNDITTFPYAKGMM